MTTEASSMGQLAVNGSGKKNSNGRQQAALTRRYDAMLNCGAPPDFAIAFQLACNSAAKSTRPTIRGVTATLF